MAAAEIRRKLWVGAGCVWLAGFQFFPGGFHHLAFWWWVVVPLTVVNAEQVWDFGSRAARWKIWLLVLIGWQLLCSVLGADGVRDVWAAVRDAVAVAVLVVLVDAIGRDRWGWRWLCVILFASGVASLGWSLIRFYPLGGLSLAEERLRNVWVYPGGLNAVLTGLLAGLAILAGCQLAGSDRRLRGMLWAGLGILGFALAATQSRGPLLALVPALGIWLGLQGRRILPEVGAAVAGALLFVVVYVLTAPSGVAPDLVERGATGRFEIWQTYVGQMTARHWWIGHGEVFPLEEEVLGWWVHHPHASWLSQLVWCGLPGVILLLGWLGWAGFRGWDRARAGEVLPLAWLVFGGVGLAVDGAQIASLASVPRIEPLLVLVPAVVAFGRAVAVSEEVGPK